MSWTTPTVRATGYLVTADDWNTDIVDNLAFLKGEAGEDIDFEDDIIGSAGTEKCGTATDLWAEGHFSKLYASRRALHGFVREQILVWENETTTAINGQIGIGTGANGDVSMGGTCQIRLQITDDDNGSNAYVYNLPEANNALDTSFNASRSPYGRFEFSLDSAKALQNITVGFRTTPSGSVLANPENWAVVNFDNSTWSTWTGDGSSATSNLQSSLTDAVRHVVEILIVSATRVEFWIDGVLVETHTTNLPTGDLEWTVLLNGDGSGTPGQYSRITVGPLYFQEDLS